MSESDGHLIAFQKLYKHAMTVFSVIHKNSILTAVFEESDTWELDIVLLVVNISSSL